MRKQHIDTSTWCIKSICKGSQTRHDSMGCHSKILVTIENLETDSTHSNFFVKCPYCGAYTKISALFIPQIIRNQIIWVYQYGR